MENLLDSIIQQVKYPKALALGYPVNREHAFEIDSKYINDVQNVFINNVGSPFSPKTYSIDAGFSGK